MTLAAASLSPEEHAAILAEYDRLTALPQPTNKTPVGCAMVIVAVVMFIVAPMVLRRVWGSVHVAFIVVDTVLVVAGVLLAIFGGGGGFARAASATESALNTLMMTTATPQERRDAAVTLIAEAYYSDGPSMTTTFNFDDARNRLGDALPYVVAIEEFLIKERKASPVFTLHEPPKQPASA